MADKSDKPINKGDIREYLKQTSDFEFEMSVLRRLVDLGFQCDHAGTYQDPVTDKIRAYEFRAHRVIANNRRLHLAVECKNIRASNPLLVYATPRTEDEAFNTVIQHEKVGGLNMPGPIEAKGARRAYPVDEPVGRSTDQPTRTASGFSGNDSQVFEKLLQALHSSRDLVRVAANKVSVYPSVDAVVPIIVLPDDLLWQVSYSADGRLQAGPEQVQHTTLVCRHEWATDAYPSQLRYVISHVEIITYGGLSSRLDFLTGPNGLFSTADYLLRNT